MDQFKVVSAAENHLLDHLRSSNLLKRKSYLLANHLINNQLYTDEDYMTDLNRTDDEMIDDLFGNFSKDNQVELDSSNEYSIVSYRFVYFYISITHTHNKKLKYQNFNFFFFISI